MRVKPVSAFSIAVLVATMAVSLVTPSVVGAVSSPQAGSAGRSGPDTFRFMFNGHQSLRSGTRVIDATGHGHDGVVRTSGAGHLTVVKSGVKGTHAAGFPRICKGCNRAIISIAGRPSLNPRLRAFTFGAAVRLTPKQAPAKRDPNILSKGMDRHHQFKLHLLGAKPRCVFAGLAHEILITSKQPIDDGSWHRVVCARSRQHHRLFVDGVLKAASNSLSSGLIAQKGPVKIGGRAVGHAGSNDQFHGDLDDVFLHIGR